MNKHEHVALVISNLPDAVDTVECTCRSEYVAPGVFNLDDAVGAIKSMVGVPTKVNTLCLGVTIQDVCAVKSKINNKTMIPNKYTHRNKRTVFGVFSLIHDIPAVKPRITNE